LQTAPYCKWTVTVILNCVASDFEGKSHICDARLASDAVSK